MGLLKWTINDIVEVIEGCVLNDFDFISFIEGNRGLGKSTLMFKILTRLNTRGLVKFNPYKHLVYSRDDTIKLLATETKIGIGSDEMINVAYNRDFYETDQKVLLKGLNMYRDSLNVFFGCIPKFDDLDKQIKKLCKMRISVIKRGHALIHIPLKGIFLPDPWDTNENIKREGKNRKAYMKLTTVKGILTYSDLTEEQKKTYRKLKQSKRGQVFEGNLIDDITGPSDIIESVYNLVIKGHISKEGLDSVCRVNNKSITNLTNKLNLKLREDPDINNSLKYYLDKAKEKASNKGKIKSYSKENHNHSSFKAPILYKIGKGKSYNQTEKEGLNH